MRTLGSTPQALDAKCLTTGKVIQIDAILMAAGDIREVDLIVQHGELGSIKNVESYRAWDAKHA